MPDRSISPHFATLRLRTATLRSSRLVVGAPVLALALTLTLTLAAPSGVCWAQPEPRTAPDASPRPEVHAESPPEAQPETHSTARSGLDPICEPSAEVASILDLANRVAADCGFTAECLDKQAAILEPIFGSHPDNLHLARAVQDLWNPFGPRAQNDPEGRAQWVERFQRRAEENPDDPAALYLYARALEDPEQALEVFRQAVAKDPEFPWAHLGVAAMTLRGAGGEGPPDGDVLQHEIGAFLDRCPARLATAAQFLDRIPDKELWRAHAERGREALERLGTERALKRYPALWEIQYASTPLEHHDQVDPQVRADLERIESLGLEDREDWWTARSKGYEMLGDDEARQRVETAHQETSPCTQKAVFDRYQQWTDENPGPTGQATEEDQTAQSRRLWDATGEWIETCPEAILYWQLRMHAATELDDLPDDEVLAAVDRFLDLAGDGGTQSSQPVELTIAQLYADRGVRLDRVRALAQTGLEKGIEDTKRTLETPGLPPEIRKLLAESEPYFRLQALQASTKAAIGLEHPDEARELLLDLRALADEMRPGDDAEARQRQLFEAIDGTYWTLRSDLATLEQNPVDAAAFRARAAAYLPDDADEKREEARSTWLAAGGSEEAWQALIDGLRNGGGAASADRQKIVWDEQNLPLPEFELADLSGGTWHRADLEGKTVFANIWATWCGPCRQELPLVETLHERLADRDDVEVVTLNIDTNPALALHFMEKEGYTFPVLQAGALINQLGKNGAVPRSWILDPSAVLRRERIGFGREAGWVDGVLEMLDEVGAEPPGTATQDGP